MRHIIGAILVCLVVSGTAQSQTVFKLAGISLFAGCAADLAATHYGISRGAHEANPLLGSNPLQLSAISIGLTSTSFLSTARLHAVHPKLATGIRLGFAAARFAIAFNNVRIVR